MLGERGTGREREREGGGRGTWKRRTWIWRKGRVEEGERKQVGRKRAEWEGLKKGGRKRGRG